MLNGKPHHIRSLHCRCKAVETDHIVDVLRLHAIILHRLQLVRVSRNHELRELVVLVCLVKDIADGRHIDH